MIKLKFLLFFILFVSSCTTIYNKMQEDIIKTEDKFVLIQDQRKLECVDQKVGMNIAVESRHLDEEAVRLLDRNNYLFVEKVALLVLRHSLVRPDVIGPHSRIQLLFFENQKVSYYDFIPQQQNQTNLFTLFYSLESLLKKHKAKRSLKQLIKQAQKDRSSLIVDKSFNQFLEKNIKSILANQEMAKLYTKGQQVLQVGESMPYLNLLKTHESYLKQKANLPHISNSHMFEVKTSIPSTKARCNFDSKLYDKGIYIVQPHEINNTLALSLTEGTSKLALINVGQEIQLPLQPIGKTGYFLNKKFIAPSSLCMAKNKDFYIQLLSNKGRDPAQFLFQLLNKSETLTNQSSLKSEISAGRKLKLFLPERYIVESHKFDSEVIDQFTKENIPLYHSSSLGLIWGQRFNSSGTSIFTDERQDGTISCPK